MGRWQTRDHYFTKAKRQGYAARSVFKLEEADRRFRLLRPGYRVLDLGCHPGSWLQYCLKVVGPQGMVVGVDSRPLTSPPSGAHFVQADVLELEPSALAGIAAEFDVVLSDLAPSTTGIRSVDSDRSEVLFERALLFAEHLLAPNGHFLGKLFQGGGFDALLRRLKAMFQQVRCLRPRATRKSSKELYLLGMRRRP